MSQISLGRRFVDVGIVPDLPVTRIKHVRLVNDIAASLERANQLLAHLLTLVVVLVATGYSGRNTAVAEQALEERSDELRVALRDLQAAQVRLVETERSVALGQLAAGMAHEVNTPLGALRSSTDSLEQLLDKSLEGLTDGDAKKRERAERRLQRVPDFLSTIRDAATRIGDASASLERFAAVDEAERKPLALSDSLDSVIALLGDRLAGTRLARDRDAEPAVEVMCHAARMNQALRALIEHAVAVADAEVRLSVSRDDDSAEIRLHADGETPSEEACVALFELDLVQQQGRVGLQLALPLAKRAIEEAEGSVVVKPAKEGGTEVVVRLSLSSA